MCTSVTHPSGVASMCTCTCTQVDLFFSFIATLFAFHVSFGNSLGLASQWLSILSFVSFRLDTVQTEDELRDVYHHFMLYYGRDVIAMKNKKISQITEDQQQQQQSLEEDEIKEFEKTSVKHAKRYILLYRKGDVY